MRMARAPRDPRARLDRPGQRPLLQGHLKSGGRRDPALEGASANGQPAEVTEPPEPTEDTTPEPTKPRSAQPAAEGAQGEGDAIRGKATKSPAEVATRPHLEGPDQGPK